MRAIQNFVTIIHLSKFLESGDGNYDWISPTCLGPHPMVYPCNRLFH